MTYLKIKFRSPTSCFPTVFLGRRYLRLQLQNCRQPIRLNRLRCSKRTGLYQGYRLKHRRRIQAASGRKRCRKLYRQSPRWLSRRFAKIADNCFETKIFQSEYADKIIQYVREKYRHELEYLWQKFPENAIVRRSDNQKWYLALLTVEKNKLGLDGSGKTEIIDLRINPDELKT